MLDYHHGKSQYHCFVAVKVEAAKAINIPNMINSFKLIIALNICLKLRRYQHMFSHTLKWNASQIDNIWPETTTITNEMIFIKHAKICARKKMFSF